MTSAGADVPDALALRGISKRFGNVVALENVSMRVRPGTVHALLGENGAGKSTLMNIAFGTITADAGEVLVRSAPGASAGPRPGVGMVHQHLSLVPALTAVENFALGGRGRFDRQAARKELEALAVASGLRVPADAPVRDLTLVQQQRLEILKALGRNASLLIMDEPTAVLAPAEIRDLLAWIRTFATGSRSVVLVTHKLREALAVADDITVLRRGQVVWSGRGTHTSEAQLADAIFPEGMRRDSPTAASGGGDVRVRARDATITRDDGSVAITDATFEALAGEIVGIAAVEGSGQRELLLALAGLLRATRGTLEVADRIAYIPADRSHEGLIPAFTLAENVALRGAGARRGRMPWDDVAAKTDELIRRFSIAAPGPTTRAGALSGGNQQRLVVARELSDAVAVVVADNPARGLDLNAAAFVFEQLRLAAARGAAVFVHSSDLDEVLSVATRVLVVFDGRVSASPPDREAVGRAMLGLA